LRSHSFRSEKFTIQPGEDEATNPFCYGKSLAEWLAVKFSELGYKPESVIPEDWGWCLVLQREPFLLWIGCGNETQSMLETVTLEAKASFVPKHEDLRWRCIVQAECPPWMGYFWRRLLRLENPEPHVLHIEQQLVQVLRSEPQIFDLEADEE
jgi:hypothetical protein